MSSFHELLSTTHNIIDKVEETANTITDASDINRTMALTKALNQLCERCQCADVLVSIAFVIAQAIDNLDPETRSMVALAMSQMVCRVLDIHDAQGDDDDDEDEAE